MNTNSAFSIHRVLLGVLTAGAGLLIVATFFCESDLWYGLLQAAFYVGAYPALVMVRQRLRSHPPRPSRARLALKWGGLAVCLLLTVGTVADLARPISWVGCRGTAGFGVTGPVFWLAWREAPTIPYSGSCVGPIRTTSQGPNDFSIRYSHSLEAWLVCGFLPWAESRGGIQLITIPLLFVCMATALVWWWDRRKVRPGFCAHCGYNLTGNVSGICPECGEKVPQAVRERVCSVNGVMRNRRQFGDKNRRFIIGCVLIVLLGCVGGYVLAGPATAGCGGLVGSAFALPLGLLFAGLCARYRLSVYLVCAGQFAGALFFGLVLFQGTLGGDTGIEWALLGQLMGGSLAVLLAFLWRKRLYGPGHCATCGYDLTGNVSGVCPECGEKVRRSVGGVASQH